MGKKKLRNSDKIGRSYIQLLLEDYEAHSSTITAIYIIGLSDI